MYHGFCNRGGCHVDAKGSTAVTTIPKAQATGRLKVVTRAHVTSVDIDTSGRVSGVTFRWLPEPPYPAYYGEQMGVFLKMNKPHRHPEESCRKWAFRCAARHGRVPTSYGTDVFGDFVFFKGDLSPL